jgi:hypothetical protein
MQPMKKLTVISAMYALLYVMIFLTSVAHAQQAALPFHQPGAARDTFLRSTADSCLETQNASPANKFISRVRLARFCNCYATALADTVTAPEVEAMAKDQATDSLRQKAQTATTQYIKQSTQQAH